MKLYDSFRAPNPRRVRWFMEEKGITGVELVDVSIMRGAHRDPEYLAKAGLPNVPLLEMDDGTAITESVAICRYLESRFPEPNLMGRTPEEVAVIEMWTRRVELMAAHPLMIGVRHTHPGMGALEQQNKAVGEWSLASGERALRIFERRLAESEWIAADRLTIADILLFISLDFVRGMLKRPIPEELANVKRWFDAMAARPAAQAAR